jgi:hypothetical protein
MTAVSRLSAWLGTGRSELTPRRRLSVAEWSALLDSVAATLTSPPVIRPIADLAGVDPITVKQPRVLHLTSGPPMPELLPSQLRPYPRWRNVARGSHAGRSSLDLTDPAKRSEQVDRWLIQMAADAGLLGMKQLVAEMRGQATS